ncbi:MAG: helix-turn-helix transcriptional regulator [Clostridia bacterium]|nr:helix-turn-helix transcriptional regulator [Clostridia bacterium]
MNYIMAIGLRIEMLRRQKEVTQRELAVRCKLSRTTINATIKGRASIVTITTILKICNALQITCREFFDSELFENITY